MSLTDIVVEAVRDLGRATKVQVHAHLGGKYTAKQVANGIRNAVTCGRLVSTSKPAPGTATLVATYRVKPEKVNPMYASVFDYAQGINARRTT